MPVGEQVQHEVEELIQAAYRASADVGKEVERILREGRELPLSHNEAAALLAEVIRVLKEGAQRRGDTRAAESLAGDVSVLIERAVQARARLLGQRGAGPELKLEGRNGVDVVPSVKPTPFFHTKPVPMKAGYVKLTDIKLWDANERLDIHLAQFQQKHGRKPTHTELLDVMLGKMKLPGIPPGDEFEVEALARSIAVNGVQKPPILDRDGTLLDGNRRVAACHLIHNSSEFGLEEKKRVEYVWVWQLTEHATDVDRDAVVVSLNFESACKKEWPEYIKARKVYEEWRSMLVLEPRALSQKRQAEMKRDLSKKFALGPDTAVVSRYLKMMDWAIDFEEYLINEKGHDEYEVQHRTNKYFQYFDELSKGARAGGVAHALGQQESYKQLVFDLLFQGKFRNWRLVRYLKHNDEDVQKDLERARAETDVDKAKEVIEDTLTAAHARTAEARKIGANARIETFVTWLENLPVRAFSDELMIKRENLKRLVNALRLVEVNAAAGLGET